MIHEEYHDNGKNVTRLKGEEHLLALFRHGTIEDHASHAPQVPNIAKILSQLGFSKVKITEWMQRAKVNGSSLDDEILMESFVDEAAFYGAIARQLRLPLQTDIAASAIHYTAEFDKQLIKPRVLRIYPKKAAPQLLIVPELSCLKALASILDSYPHLRYDLIITTRSAIRKAVWLAGAENRTQRAITELSEKQPLDSARTILLGKQGFIFGIAIGATAAAMLHPASPVLLAIHIFCSSFYFFANAFRFFALMPHLRLTWEKAETLPTNTVLPIYSILVPLHREKEVIHQLIRGLDNIVWPRSRLDIKLICEEDDHETIEALSCKNLGPEYEIIRVPPSEPRTKPKALQYAMPSVRGQYVTIYDAEDRPHPQQLQEAYRKFYHGDRELACVQAPLVITNIGQSWISALFAAEYGGLFRRLLPMLAIYRLPLPLGGTSNHFKTAILRSVGGWDPYNVAEDADLGLRLSRRGYQIDVIQLPTLEDAPTSVSIWMKQRMRWYKGWLISWLVMMRSPLETAKQLGLARFTAAQFIIGGVLLSSLSHPLILTYIALTLYSGLTVGISSVPSLKLCLLGIDAVNIFCSYIVFFLLSHAALTPIERQRLGVRKLFIPVYWLLLAAAAWYSIYELKREPYRWNKTPHRPSA